MVVASVAPILKDIDRDYRPLSGRLDSLVGPSAYMSIGRFPYRAGSSVG
jgi:hypothetical protein